MLKSFVFDISKSCWHDGPGLRTTIFLKGCSLDCAWCHNPEGHSPSPELIIRMERCMKCGNCISECPYGIAEIPGKTESSENNLPSLRIKCKACGRCAKVCPTEARRIIGIELTVDDLMQKILEDKPFYDETGGGVTFSGGEPLASFEFLCEVLKECRKHNVNTAVETSLFAQELYVIKMALLADLIICDIKIIDSLKHIEYTGAHNSLILDNLKRLSHMNVNVLIRLTIVPGINDTELDLNDFAKLILGLNRNWPVELIAFHCRASSKYSIRSKWYRFEGVKPPDAERMDFIAENLRMKGLKVIVGNSE